MPARGDAQRQIDIFDLLAANNMEELLIEEHWINDLGSFKYKLRLVYIDRPRGMTSLGEFYGTKPELTELLGHISRARFADPR